VDNADPELERGDEPVRHLVRREGPDGRAQPKLTYTDCLELPFQSASWGRYDCSDVWRFNGTAVYHCHRSP
jgi:hypothetical protein